MHPSYLGSGMTSQRSRDRLVQRLREAGIRHHKVLQAIASTPRHLFMDEALASRAYEDTALPIGYGQTISQPYIVARMSEALIADDEDLLDNVLEIGTGSGYQAAILAQLARNVYSLERIEPLYKQARQCLSKLGLHNVYCKYADGTVGWESKAPFKGIIATAAPVEIPQALLQQLTVGGRLVIPVGQVGEQALWRVTRTEQGFERTLLERVIFVPFLSGIS